MSRIGVFVCWCGENIARTVDVEKVVEACAELPGVRCGAALQVHVLGPGPGDDSRQDRGREAGWRGGGLLLAAHAFEDLPARGGHRGPESLPARNGQHPRAMQLGASRPGPGHRRRPSDLIRLSVAKVRYDHALEPIRVPVTRRALVIGGGVAGIQAALDIADSGYEVVLVEREPSIGGKMAGLVGDLPHARLLAVHPDAAHGGSGAASAHPALHLLGSGGGGGLHRQLRGRPSARRRATWT